MSHVQCQRSHGRQPLPLTKEKDAFFLVDRVNATGTHRIVFPLEEADEYIDHYDLKLTRQMKLTAKSIKQLDKLGLKHHVLGTTFP